MKHKGQLVLIIITLLFVCRVLCRSDAQPSARDEQAVKDQEECTANLKQIFAAIRAYRNDHNDLPNWLSDLVPQYLNQSVLICPISKRTGEYPQFGFFDPKLRVSYLFEFCTARVPPNLWGGSTMTMREWKTKQMGLIGPEIPMVRCPMHDPVMNLGYDGGIYGSELTWERKYAGRISMDALAPYAGKMVKMWVGPYYIGEIDPREWPYQRAFDLYLDGKLDAAYAGFQKIVESSQPTRAEVYNAEGWMGAIQRRLGHLDKAIEHFERAQVAVKKLEKPDPLWINIDQLEHLENIYLCLMEQGKVALAQRHLNEAEQIFQNILASPQGKGTLSAQTCSHPYHVIREVSVNRADFLRYAGRFEESERLLNDIAREAMGKQCMLVLGDAWESLAQQDAFLGRIAEASDLAARVSFMRYNCQAEYRRPMRQILYASYLAQREGVSQKVWDMVEESLERMKKSLSYADLFAGQTVKGLLLIREGLNSEALRVLNSVIDESRKNNFQSHLADALEVRAKLKLETGDNTAAGNDLKEALVIYRSFGRKDKEPDLYELYARLNARLGNYDQSLQLWEQAFELCQNLKIPFRALAMLLGIGELQLSMGQADELNKTWERIDRFVQTHSGLPDSTLLRLHLARLDYLKSRENRVALDAAFEKARNFARGSKLSFYQSRPLLAYDLDKNLEVRPAPKKSVAPTAQPRAIVDLQPILMNTRVAPTELARGRFVLSNPSAREAQGTLSLDASNFHFAWSTNEQGLVAKLSPGPDTAENGLSLHVAPGQQVVVMLESASLEANKDDSVAVNWREQQASARAKWEFSFGPDPRKIVVANASLAEDNPFYAIEFYHEVYFRGDETLLKNLRVETSEPCRVEIVEQTHHTLLAIDADGNGSFADAGDVVYVDADKNLYPDITLDKETDVAILELFIFPHLKQNRNQREIKITLAWEENGAWVPQAVNTLVLK